MLLDSYYVLDWKFTKTLKTSSTSIRPFFIINPTKYHFNHSFLAFPPTSLHIYLTFRSLQTGFALLTIPPLIFKVVVYTLTLVFYKRLSSLAPYTFPIRCLKSPLHTHTSLRLFVKPFIHLAFYTNTFDLVTVKPLLANAPTSLVINFLVLLA